MTECESCGLPIADPEDVIAGLARYEDSPGGHADRHTLVMEAAEQALANVQPTEGARHD